MNTLKNIFFYKKSPEKMKVFIDEAFEQYKEIAKIVKDERIKQS